MKTCRISGCHKEVRVRKLCITHYNRMLENGSIKKLQEEFNGRCRDCGEPKVRIKVESRKANGRFNHVDEKGRLWNGFQCPECRNGKLLVKIKPKSKKVSVDDDFIYC